jgi:hypothetical protein
MIIISFYTPHEYAGIYKIFPFNLNIDPIFRKHYIEIQISIMEVVI